MTIFQFSFGDGFAGSAKMALLSSLLLKEKGHNLLIFVSKGSLTEKRSLEYGLNFVSLDHRMKYKKLISEIEEHFKKYKPEIIIGHHSLDRKTGITLKRKHPEVINIAYRHNITKSLPIIGSFIYNRYTDYLIACSQGVADSLTDSGIKKTKVKILYNGINIPEELEKISGLNIRKKYLPDRKIVLGLSTWFHKERKGFDILFKAFSGLDDSYLLLLVGIPEEQQNEVKTYASEFNISPEKLMMPGYVENIWEYYKAMDIFLLPSRSEGFSLALLEAGAAGLPIIASDIPGNNEFIKEGINGLLFPVDNPALLKEKIMELRKNTELRKKIGLEAKRLVFEKYTIEKYADNLDKFLSGMYLKQITR
jgi:glycosyltransferase involved in cell wall biosynthesis